MMHLPQEPLRWGILSTSRIGMNAVIPALQTSPLAEVAAISSRNLAQAKAAAEKAGIPKAYGSYEDLLHDPEVDVVYNPLPNHLHLPYTRAALNAGKHVLCEKPLTLNTEEAVEMAQTAEQFSHLKVMEAFMYRFHPQWGLVKRWMHTGRIGRVQAVRSVFTYFNDDPTNIRNGTLPGGGGLLDVGCYCLSAMRFLLGREPRRVLGLVEDDPVFKVDRLVTALVDFGDVQASFVCGTQAERQQVVEVIGATGRILIEMPFFQSDNQPAKLRLVQEGWTEDHTTEPVNNYVRMCEALTQAIWEQRPVPISLATSIANMRAIDAVFHSKAIGGWVDL
ncbi:MAG TPA: Gfo/Idh/MocA family oxidoreductase [Rhodothermales bacterium]|nr:Gfo/Idh/MocA family oxidoreductase [Rhodothermales bacterium]